MSEDGNEPTYKCEYIDLAEGAEPEVLNWLARAGKAQITYDDGSKYEGGFDSNRLKSGMGKYTWIKPSEEEGEEPTILATYEGNYENGMKSGLGKMTYPNGNQYTGEWKDNLQHGQGTCVYKVGGDIYSGDWISGKRIGQGTYQFGSDESMMQGFWENGSIKEGKWILKDGTVYTGKFVNGVPNGAGTYTFPSGIVQKGSYISKNLSKPDEEEDETKTIMRWKGDNIVTC